MKCNNVTGEAVSPNDLHSQYEIDYKPDEAFVTIQSRGCNHVLCCNMECSEFFKNIIFKGTVRKVADSWEIKIHGTFINRQTKSIVGILNKSFLFHDINSDITEDNIHRIYEECSNSLQPIEKHIDDAEDFYRYVAKNNGMDYDRYRELFIGDYYFKEDDLKNFLIDFFTIVQQYFTDVHSFLGDNIDSYKEDGHCYRKKL